MKLKGIETLPARFSAALLVAAIGVGAAHAQAASPRPASEATRAANAAALARAEVDEATEQAEDEAARRGLIAQVSDGVIRNGQGQVVLDLRKSAFLMDETAPATVNPRLWRQARRNAQHGLFEVARGAIWQVRGYDASVMTIIRTDNGVIIVDPLTIEETARAGMALFRQHVGDWPIKAVIFTHSHTDHYGGVGGVISAQSAERGGVEIIAPHGFTEAAASENVLAGPAMVGRAMYMFGARLPSGPTGYVDTGIGARIPFGTTGFMRPTHTIGPDGERMTIDGLEIIFADAADTEAPAELFFYIPRYKALQSAELVTKTFHNLLTLRGAQVRDALRWSQVIDEMIQRWGGEAEVRLASHGWPTFGADRVVEELIGHRDMYRFVHDRTLAAANAGATIQELPDILKNTPGFATYPTARGYYGTAGFNAKAVYQRYFGWWDGVPADFNPLAPEEAARGYVQLAGGAAKMLEAGRRAYDKGEYRWAATLLNHIVFAQPGNAGAREALADSYEQLGYQAESGAVRNYYLSSAAQLRSAPAQAGGHARPGGGFPPATPTLQVFNALATRYAPAAAVHEPRTLRFLFTDTGERIVVELSGIVAIPRLEVADSDNRPVTTELRLTHSEFADLLAGRSQVGPLPTTGAARVSGDTAVLRAWLAALKPPTAPFNVVEP